MEWRKIPGFSRYEVSDDGQVRCVVAQRRWKPGLRKSSLTDKGYRRIALISDEGRQTMFRVHRLVALVFLGPPPSPSHQTAHNNGNRSDNRVQNLRWATAAENIGDKAVHGTNTGFVGVKNRRCKLAETQALEIVSSIEPSAVLATRFGVAKSTIRHIRNGQTWKHIERPKRAA